MPRPVVIRQAVDAPAAAGAYVLALILSAPRVVPIARFATPTLAPGLYLYCGSARGPGGLRARINRHFAAEKKRRWNIDHLSQGGTVVEALCVEDGNECDLRARLSALDGLSVPVPGFGAADCRTCPSHLLAATRGLTPTRIWDAIGA